MPYRHRLTTLLALAVVLLPAAPAMAIERYTFGIVPQQSAVKTARTWAPIIHYLGRATGSRFILKTEEDIPAFEAQVRAGAYDFAYMNPYHYVVFHEQAGYRALAKAKDTRIHGILVVPSDSPIQSLQELDGREVAFPAPTAFAASLLPRAHLKRLGISIKPVYVSSHDLVYLNVLRGNYVAGGGVFRTLHNMDGGTRDGLRVLWTTDGYTPHAIAAHPRVPDKVMAAAQQALVELDGSMAGQAMLQRLQLNGFDAAADADWDDVRQLGLDAL